MFRKQFLLILFLFMFFLIPAQEIPGTPGAGIPVIDITLWEEILKEQINFDFQFGGYVIEYQKYLDLFKDLKGKFEIMMQGMDLESLRKVTPARVLQYLNSSYLKDLFNLDSWWEYFKNFQSLDERYTWLNDYSYIYDNPLYNNEKWKGYTDFLIKEEQDSQKDIDNALKLCKDIRDWESEQMTKLAEHQRQIEFYSQNGTGTTLTSRMMTVENMMSIEMMRIDLQMDLLLRTMLEMDTKNRVKAKAIERKKILLEKKYSNEEQ